MPEPKPQPEKHQSAKEGYPQRILDLRNLSIEEILIRLKELPSFRAVITYHQNEDLNKLIDSLIERPELSNYSLIILPIGIPEYERLSEEDKKYLLEFLLKTRICYSDNLSDTLLKDLEDYYAEKIVEELKTKTEEEVKEFIKKNDHSFGGLPDKEFNELIEKIVTEEYNGSYIDYLVSSEGRRIIHNSYISTNDKPIIENIYELYFKPYETEDRTVISRYFSDLIKERQESGVNIDVVTFYSGCFTDHTILPTYLGLVRIGPHYDLSFKKSEDLNIEFEDMGKLLKELSQLIETEAEVYCEDSPEIYYKFLRLCTESPLRRREIPEEIKKKVEELFKSLLEYIPNDFKDWFFFDPKNMFLREDVIQEIEQKLEKELKTRFGLDSPPKFNLRNCPNPLMFTVTLMFFLRLKNQGKNNILVITDHHMNYALPSGVLSSAKSQEEILKGIFSFLTGLNIEIVFYNRPYYYSELSKEDREKYLSSITDSLLRKLLTF